MSLASLATPVFPVPREYRVPMDPTEMMVPKDLRVHRVKMESLVHPDHEVTLEMLDMR